MEPRPQRTLSTPDRDEQRRVARAQFVTVTTSRKDRA